MLHAMQHSLSHADLLVVSVSQWPAVPVGRWRVLVVCQVFQQAGSNTCAQLNVYLQVAVHIQGRCVCISAPITTTARRVSGAVPQRPLQATCGRAIMSAVCVLDMLLGVMRT